MDFDIREAPPRHDRGDRSAHRPEFKSRAFAEGHDAGDVAGRRRLSARDNDLRDRLAEKARPRIARRRFARKNKHRADEENDPRTHDETSGPHQDY